LLDKDTILQTTDDECSRFAAQSYPCISVYFYLKHCHETSHTTFPVRADKNAKVIEEAKEIPKLASLPTAVESKKRNLVWFNLFERFCVCLSRVQI